MSAKMSELSLVQHLTKASNRLTTVTVVAPTNMQNGTQEVGTQDIIIEAMPNGTQDYGVPEPIGDATEASRPIG